VDRSLGSGTGVDVGGGVGRGVSRIDGFSEVGVGGGGLGPGTMPEHAAESASKAEALRSKRRRMRVPDSMIIPARTLKPGEMGRRSSPGVASIFVRISRGRRYSDLGTLGLSGA
jgi:hypothetical protein